MDLQRNLQVNRYIFFAFLLFLSSCTNTHLVDVNMAIPENNWSYAKNVTTTFEVKDSGLAYHLSFKIRNNTAYRYSNIYVVMRLKGDSLSKNTRYQFQLAKADGEWLGKGSGDLYSNTFSLLKNFHFPKAGKYTLEVEQNMRDNPLVGISDVGLTVEEVKTKN